MTEIREIGIEKELFLMQDDIIKEPKLFGFPRDDFEFLVEIRSLPSDRFYPVYTTLKAEELQYSLRANKFGMKLDDKHVKFASRKWVDELWQKYNLYALSDDFTQNIYPLLQGKQSYHLGKFDFSKDEYKLTAGMHVHFSSRDPETGGVIELPVKKIVKSMDDAFFNEIKYSGRLQGEYEMKSHGFEYRSLPADADVYKVLKTAFRIIREV